MGQKKIKYSKEVEVEVDIDFPAYRKYTPLSLEKYYKFIDDVTAYIILIDKRDDSIFFEKKEMGIVQYNGDFINGLPPYDLTEAEFETELDKIRALIT